MNLDPASPMLAEVLTAEAEEQAQADTKAWRYSIAPEALALSAVDVREPLPSPTLPEIPTHEIFVGCNEEPAEPVSSGFVSPRIRASIYNSTEAMNILFPPSQTSSKADVENVTGRNGTELTTFEESDLERTMTHLQVSAEDLRDGSSEESPILSHLRRRSYGASMEISLHHSSQQSIYLSETAEAAAESAKAKRKLLKDSFRTQDDTDDRREDEHHSSSPEQRTGQLSTLISCPDPSLHVPSSSMIGHPLSVVRSNVMMSDHGDAPDRAAYPIGRNDGHRATATGSPMPFTRTRNQMPPVYYDEYFNEPSSAQSSRVAQCVRTVNDHFSPGWYYAEERTRPPIHPAYSFSTAASKVFGSDQAPDSRIRDSYKTDTLTAIAIPTNRYRKNGIGAEMMSRGVGRFYQRGPSSIRTSNARTRPGSRQTYSSGSDVRFRSSPPPGPRSDHYTVIRHKRALDDTFTVPEFRQRLNLAHGLHESDETMQVDKQTNATAQLGIFGASTPGILQQARQGIRELSPNVQAYRKGIQEYSHLHKKRRPSYWDNDLKEIRESPAGRGGVNSPVSAQASMRAEFEIASLGNTEMEFDENDLSGEVARAGNDLESRLSGLDEQQAVSVPKSYALKV